MDTDSSSPGLACPIDWPAGPLTGKGFTKYMWHMEACTRYPGSLGSQVVLPAHGLLSQDLLSGSVLRRRGCVGPCHTQVHQRMHRPETRGISMRHFSPARHRFLSCHQGSKCTKRFQGLSQPRLIPFLPSTSLIPKGSQRPQPIMDASRRTSVSTDYSVVKPSSDGQCHTSEKSEKKSFGQRCKEAFKDIGSPPTQRFDKQTARKSKPSYGDVEMIFPPMRL